MFVFYHSGSVELLGDLQDHGGELSSFWNDAYLQQMGRTEVHWHDGTAQVSTSHEKLTELHKWLIVWFVLFEKAINLSRVLWTIYLMW